MDKSKFKEELRGRIHDFSTACALTNLSDNKPQGKKEKEIEERYLRLEAWIISKGEDIVELPFDQNRAEKDPLDLDL